MKNLFVVAVYLLLVLCSFAEENIRDKFRVHFLYDEVNVYIEEAKKDGADLDSLYKKYIIDNTPLENKENLGFGYLDTPKNLKKLKENSETLKKNNVVEMIYEVLEKSNEKLKLDKLDVYVVTARPNNFYVRHQMNGVWAIANRNEDILIGVNPQAKQWKKILKHMVAHEYNHQVCFDRAKIIKYNLLERMILEGKADTFAEKVVNIDIEVPWRRNYEKTQEQEIWDKMKDRIYEEDWNYIFKVLFGGEDYKKYAGYNIGYNIMQNFIKNNPNVSIEEWTEMDAEEILEKSKYSENLLKDEI